MSNIYGYYRTMYSIHFLFEKLKERSNYYEKICSIDELDDKCNLLCCKSHIEKELDYYRLYDDLSVMSKIEKLILAMKSIFNPSTIDENKFNSIISYYQNLLNHYNNTYKTDIIPF